VKGLSFHPEKSWILVSTYKGDLQIWDYRVSALINTFNIINDKGEISESCIRCAQFHPTQPILACGGHDKLIHLCNYKTGRKVTSLAGHADYIRSVFFHKDRPFLISASDDTTIRIWNWQNRTQVIMITGHSHYVMCAKFHPTRSLIVSGSLDRTVRIWDYSKLLEKTQTGTGHVSPFDVEQVSVGDDHDNGVNWVSIDETNELIYSAGDDRKIRIWKIKDNKPKMEESDVLFGHSYNVCSVVYNKKTDLVISNSEDFTMKVWNRSTGICLETFKRNGEKQWILDTHPRLPLVATGTDSQECVRWQPSLLYEGLRPQCS
jgi:coatomer protein complex subunit alpha (xenin)